jgi:hypothetical protein
MKPFPVVETYSRREHIKAAINLHFDEAGKWRDIIVWDGVIGPRQKVRREVALWCEENFKEPYTFSFFNTEALTTDHMHLYAYSEDDVLWFKMKWL